MAFQNINEIKSLESTLMLKINSAVKAMNLKHVKIHFCLEDIDYNNNFLQFPLKQYSPSVVMLITEAPSVKEGYVESGKADSYLYEYAKELITVANFDQALQKYINLGFTDVKDLICSNFFNS